MTDKKFESLISKTADTYNKYKALLDIVEDEYIKRYGCAPGDQDDDFWIDSLHGACGDAAAITVKEIEDSIRLRKK